MMDCCCCCCADELLLVGEVLTVVVLVIWFVLFGFGVVVVGLVIVCCSVALADDEGISGDDGSCVVVLMAGSDVFVVVGFVLLFALLTVLMGIFLVITTLDIFFDGCICHRVKPSFHNLVTFILDTVKVHSLLISRSVPKS